MISADLVFVAIGLAFIVAVLALYRLGDGGRTLKSLIFSVRWVMVGLLVGVVSSVYQSINRISVHFAFGMMAITTILYVEYLLRFADAKSEE